MSVLEGPKRGNYIIVWYFHLEEAEVSEIKRCGRSKLDIWVIKSHLSNKAAKKNMVLKFFFPFFFFAQKI